MDLVSVFGSIPTIKNNRSILRPLRPNDAADLFAYYNNPNVYRHLDWNGPQSKEDALRVIEFWHNDFLKGWIIRFGITLPHDDTVIGTVFLNHIEGNRAEIGYELSEEHWRKGIMSDAVLSILSIAFTTLNLTRVQAFVSPDNAASQKMLEKIGFKNEGLLRQYELNSVTGAVTDMFVFAILKNDMSN